ncbi:MAG: hypothetical protein COV35_03035 [Alphaproteobacteria bacterium CG11_big_fil_rev_8_21_14_0_20_39_49]|nr:MAG: hypothetical protein COV35_03035 [Alphaproteobacteria bacterium CG11_big_fil_rev_8_21_14_0_20_39_49]
MTVIILSSFVAIFFITSLALLYFYLLSSSRNKLIVNKFEELKINHAIASQDINELKEKNSKLEAEHNKLLIAKTEAETRMQSLSEELSNTKANLEKAAREKEAAIEAKNEYMRKQELALQRIKGIEDEMKNWEKMKEEHTRNLQSSTLEVANKISSKLLDDHKREAENAKKENEKLIKQTTENLQEQHKYLVESVNSLQEGVKKSEVVHRALLSPSGAGSLGEITLENIFRNSSLIKGQDYHMQYSVSSSEGRGLRPDAVVFLPDNNVMVIDSKASKFFAELGEENIDASKEKEIYAGLKRSMNENLKGLASKEYSKAIEDEAGKSLARVYMFLPTETALEKLRKADPQFIEKAWSQGICPVGPTGLLNELLRASMIISGARQEENAKIIINQVKDLLSNVATLNEHANKLGKGLKSAIDNYDRFSGSFNRSFMSKANKICKLGVDVPKLKGIPPLSQYKITAIDYKSIDGDYSEENNEYEGEVKSLEVVK